MAELKIKADSGGGTVSFKGPATTTSNAAVQLTLPVDDGTTGQYLKTDGSGALSWATVDSTPEGTAIKSTGETGTAKFLRIDGDNTCSWQVPPDTGILATHTGVAKAWIKFQGTGTIAINASFNVTSITDNGTGDYTITFTNDISDANYAVSGACKEDTTGNGRGQVFMAPYRHAAVVGSLRINSMLSETGNVFDSGEVHVIVHR